MIPSLPLESRLYAIVIAVFVAGLTGVSAQDQSIIKTKEIAGRTWLVDPNGQPFFARGVTHVGYGHNGEDVGEFANALKELGFNSYGYGCPEFLRSDMPYAQDNDDIALIAIYRGRNAKFFDIFDPKEHARIDRAIEDVCVRNRSNANLIGNCWTDLAVWPLKNQSGTAGRTLVRVQKGTGTLLDFEDKNSLAGNNTSHKATVTLVDDVPEGGGRFAAKTVADSTAGAVQYFGTGFQFPMADLSAAGAISLWIKTDIESGFNLQIHTGAGGNSGVSVFPFSTVKSGGQWKKVTAPLARFTKPPWSKSKADLSSITKVQVTAFGNGPYDGKYVIVDSVRTDGSAGDDARPEMDAKRIAILKARRANLREPVILQRGESVDMFDGKTLDGWGAIPRVYVPRSNKFANMPADQLNDAVIKHYENSDGQINRILDRERVKDKGVWKVEDGVVIGAQTPGSIAGAYLMSEKTYGDFELTLEANPDYPIDTGIMVRAHKLGSVGFQVLVDNRPNGTIGGVYGNSIGGFFAYPFVFDADEEPLNRVANFRPGNPNALQFRGGQFQTDYAASLDDFVKMWKPNDWNEIRIRCTGRLPLIETWINGVAIAKIDTATLADIVPGYDPEAIFERIGRVGHIGLEVHDSPTRDRWAPGAKCRWRNVRIRELVCEEEGVGDGK